MLGWKGSCLLMTYRRVHKHRRQKSPICSAIDLKYNRTAICKSWKAKVWVMFSFNIVAQILPLLNSSILTCSFVIGHAQEGLKHLLIIFFHGILFIMPVTTWWGPRPHPIHQYIVPTECCAGHTQEINIILIKMKWISEYRHGWKKHMLLKYLFSC